MNVTNLVDVKILLGKVTCLLENFIKLNNFIFIYLMIKAILIKDLNFNFFFQLIFFQLKFANFKLFLKNFQ